MYKKELTSKDILIITALAGSINSAFTTPIWIVQTRMCVSKENKSAYQHFKDILKEGGILALWNGFLPGLILVLNPIINFVVYEKLRNMVVKSGKEPSLLSIFLISMVAKFIATSITYPVLTLKTKLFTGTKNESMMKILNNYIKNEGVSALYRGIFAKLFQTLLYNSLMMTAFEKISFRAKKA